MPHGQGEIHLVRPQKAGRGVHFKGVFDRFKRTQGTTTFVSGATFVGDHGGTRIHYALDRGNGRFSFPQTARFVNQHGGVNHIELRFGVQFGADYKRGEGIISYRNGNQFTGGMDLDFGDYNGISRVQTRSGVIRYAVGLEYEGRTYEHRPVSDARDVGVFRMDQWQLPDPGVCTSSDVAYDSPRAALVVFEQVASNAEYDELEDIVAGYVSLYLADALAPLSSEKDAFIDPKMRRRITIDRSDARVRLWDTIQVLLLTASFFDERMKVLLSEWSELLIEMAKAVCNYHQDDSERRDAYDIGKYRVVSKAREVAQRLSYLVSKIDQLLQSARESDSQKPTQSSQPTIEAVLGIPQPSGATGALEAIHVGNANTQDAAFPDQIVTDGAASAQIEAFSLRTEQVLAAYTKKHKAYAKLTIPEIRFEIEGGLLGVVLAGETFILDLCEALGESRERIIARFVRGTEEPPRDIVAERFKTLTWDKIRPRFVKYTTALEQFVQAYDRACDGDLWRKLRTFEQATQQMALTEYRVFRKDNEEAFLEQYFGGVMATSAQNQAKAALGSIYAKYKEARQVQTCLDAPTYKVFLKEHGAHDTDTAWLPLLKYSMAIRETFPMLAEEADDLQRDVGAPPPSGRTFPVYISEEARKRHTYVTGQSGSGKSELLKVLTHAYVSRPDHAAVVILDPHGDFAEEVARWRVFCDNDQLIYVDPYLRYQYAPTINPLSVRAYDTPQEQEHAIELRTDQLLGVFKELMRGEGTGITSQMETILMPCIDTVIRIGGTLEDVQMLMMDNPDLVRAGLRSPNAAFRRFFQQGFGMERYNQTKQSLYTKIQTLFNKAAFFSMVVGQSTFDLEAALDARKTIVFNLARGSMGQQASDAFGRFVLGMLQSIALQRARVPKTDRVPVHVFIDECQFYISESIENILTGARKYGMHLTLAQQIYGQDMSPQLKRLVMGGSTAVKIAGMNEVTTYKAYSAATGAKVEDLQKLDVGQFFLQEGNNPAFPFRTPTHLLGARDPEHYMGQEEWEQLVTRQVEQFYRSTAPPEEVEDPVWLSESSRKPRFDLPE